MSDRDKSVKKIRNKVTEQDLETISEEEALERSYYENSIIIKVNPETKLIEDMATCFSIEDTMDVLMLAPLEFISRTDEIENEKQYKDRLWKQVRIFYKAAREMLDRRYRL